MRTYTAVFSTDDRDDEHAPRFMTLTIRAKDHNDMVKQAKGLACPAGYHYIGTRDENTWHHLPRV